MDAHAVAAVLAWRSQYERLREFAGSASRLQLELLKTVAAEHARRDDDLAEWALTMYDGIQRAVVLHIAALQKVAPPDDDDAPVGRTSWIEDSAVELGRLIDALTAPDGIPFPENELAGLLELEAACGHDQVGDGRPSPTAAKLEAEQAVEVVFVLCRNRKSFVEWCDNQGYDLQTDDSPVGAKGNDSIAVRVIRLSDIEGLVADRIEILDAFDSRPDAELVAHYAHARLRRGEG